MCHSHVLISPNYNKDFQMFSFASNFTMVVVLLQKNQEGMEHPIAFMSRVFQGSKQKYKLMEKQAYALVNGLAYSETTFGMLEW